MLLISEVFWWSILLCLQECHRICLQLLTVQTCGCHDPIYPLTFAVRGKLQDIGRSCDLSYHCELQRMPYWRPVAPLWCPERCALLTPASHGSLEGSGVSRLVRYTSRKVVSQWYQKWTFLKFISAHFLTFLLALYTLTYFHFSSTIAQCVGVIGLLVR